MYSGGRSALLFSSINNLVNRSVICFAPIPAAPAMTVPSGPKKRVPIKI